MNKNISSNDKNASPDSLPEDGKQGMKERLLLLEMENRMLKQQLSQQDIKLQKHLQIYNFSPICFLRIDLNGNISRANAEAEKLFRKTVQELLHLNIRSFIHPDSLSAFLQFLHYVFESNEIATSEFRLSLNGATSPSLTISAKGLVTEDEQTCFLSLCDITKETESRQALIESKNRYIELTDSLPVAIFETDVNGIITYGNKQAKEWFGYSDADIEAGLSLIKCFPLNEHSHILERFQLSLSSSTTVTNEYSTIRSDGTIFPVQISSSAVFRNNQRIGVRGIIIDLTEQKLAEEKHQRNEAWFRDTLENMMEGYQLIDFDWRYRYLNNIAIRQSQLKETELIGRTMMEVYPEIDKSSFFQSLKKVMEERITLNIENKFTYSNAETFWFELRIHPVPTGIAILSIDISERKKAEQDILEYSERLKQEVNKQTAEIRQMADFQNAILRHAGLAIIPLSPEGIILSFNPAAEKLTGYTAEEVVGKHSPAIFNDMEKIREEASALDYLTHYPDISDEELLIKQPLYYFKDTIEREYIRKDKARVPVLLNAVTLKNEMGIVTGHVRFAIDNTERKNAEAKLRMQSAAFESFAESVIITDKDGNIQWINPAFTRLTGYTREEVIGKQPNILKSDKHTSDFYKEIWDTILSGKVWCGEVINKRKDGSLYYQECNITPVIDGSGNITNFIALQVDISYRREIEEALRKSEERWQFALDGSGLGVWDWNIQTNEEFYSLQWKKMLGYEDDEISHSATEWITRVHPDDLENCFSSMDMYLSGQKELYVNEYRMKCKDGSYTWILTRGKIVERTENGQPLRLIGTHTDITEQKYAEEKLLQALKQEKELSELKSRFVTTTSHEFRTPLSSILLSIDALIHYREVMNEDQRTLRYERIKDQTLHLSGIVEDILQLSKLQEGKLQCNPESLELTSFCRNFVDIFNEEYRLNPEISFLSSIPELIILADNRLFRQILNNLLSNAIKYSPENPVIFVEIKLSDGNIHLEISDNGIGIPEKDQKNLFTPFFRASNVSLIQGNGLGLSIVNEAVTLHGGTISVESKEGYGTSFVLELPKTIMI